MAKTFCFITTLAFALMLAGSSEAETKDECIAKIQRALDNGTFTDLSNSGDTATVVVDETVWNGVDFTVKSGMVQAFECAALGPGKHLPKIVFRSNMTNKVLGTTYYGKLTVGSE